MKKLLAILFSLFLCIFSIQAESPNYYFKQISLKDGLSQSTVNCVLSDHQGVIWIGTSFGLNRFDRERIMSYNNDKDNLFSIPGNSIIFLAEDLQHNIWIGTDRGLARYDRSKDRFMRITFAGLPLHVHSSVVTDNGVLFFGTGTAFRYSYVDNRITFLPVNGPERVTSAFTHAYIYDKQKQIVLLVCRRNGLWWYHLATGKLERISFIPAKEITSVCLDSSGNIWLSVYADGVYGYTSAGDEFCHLNTGNLLSNDVVLDIKEIDGKLWLATDGGGLNVYDLDTQGMRVISHIPGNNNSLPVNSFGCLYNDQEKNIWAGSIRGGLIGLKRTYFYTYGDAQLNSTSGLSYKTVTSLYEDRDHILWLGTDGDGINRFDPRTSQFRHYPATFDKKVVSIVEYDEDELLLSIFSQGLYRFHKKTGELQEYIVADAEKSRRLFRLGLAVHLGRLDDASFYIYSDSVYLYNQQTGHLDAIRCKEEGVVLSALMEVSGGEPDTYLRSLSNLLVLDHKDRSIGVFYTPPDSIGTIGAACRDKAGCFWLGTSSGLYRYDPVTKRTSTIEENRFAGTSSLGFDRQGRLWIGTHNGLYAYIPEEGKTVVFGESDGVYANEYLFKPPLLTASGDLYMAGVNGLVYIRNSVPFPEEADPSINLLDVELDGISVGSDVIRDNNQLSIPWDYTSLNARIIVKEKDLMRKKLFRYYIKGSLNEMIERSSHTISFHALSVGEYHIWVSCNKRNGDWSTPVQLLAITVTPPWWKTTGFLILLILLILFGSVLTAWLVVLKKERKMVWAIKEHERKTYEDRVRFLINISHELRTPLTLIYAPLKRLLASGEVKDDKLLHLLTGIFRQTRRIKDNINMVLDVRKMEVGGESLSLTKQPVNDWLQEISSDFDLEFQVRNIQLVYDFDESLGEVPFDASKCEIVLSNLLMNALKFSKPNTIVVLSTRRKPDYVRISLSDEGIGLDHVEIDRLFTRFYQGDHDRKGSGIGLSYARMLVEMHGGNIGAQANEGRGATFFFELPLENTSVPIEARPYMSQLLQTSDVEISGADDYPVAGYTVMIVEDEPELRNYLKDELSGSFKEVYVAEDGRQALEMIQAKLPDLVVSDVMMPYMNGFELCRRIKSDVGISHIPVILLTARTDNESTVQGYKLGADMYVPKPFDLGFLLAVLRNQLKSREIIRNRYKEAEQIVSPKTDTISNADEQFMRRLNELISSNLTNPDLDVQFVAAQMAMSRASLYNKLKLLAGISIGDYINKFRMAEAVRLLADKDLSIQEVSEKTGFSHQRYFSTVFKQIYGVTPSQYRQDL